MIQADEERSRRG